MIIVTVWMEAMSQVSSHDILVDFLLYLVILGTGACPTGAFYCHNEGHIGSLIPSTRVRDGLCGTQCCLSGL